MKYFRVSAEPPSFSRAKLAFLWLGPILYSYHSNDLSDGENCFGSKSCALADHRGSIVDSFQQFLALRRSRNRSTTLSSLKK